MNREVLQSRDGGAEQLRAALSRRAALLSELLKQDPARALAMALPEDVQASLRAQIPDTQDLEASGEWEGPATLLVADDFEQGKSRNMVSMMNGGEKLDVYFAGRPPFLKCGDRLRVRGMRLGLLVGAATATAQAVAAAQSCSPTGNQSIVALIVNFGSTTVSPSLTPDYANAVLFGSGGHSVDGYWREVSYGKTSASGIALGPFTLSGTFSCGDRTSLDQIASAAVAAADSLVDFTNYGHVFIIMPRLAGCHDGIATVGCDWISSPSKGFLSAGVAWLAADRFAAAPDSGVQLASHEGGHNLGLGHASSMSYTNPPLGPVGGLLSAWTDPMQTGHTEYGDNYAEMGLGAFIGSYYIGHYTAAHKSLLGWFAPGNVQEVSSSGTFVLQPIESATGGLQAIHVRRGLANNAYLWIEYRQSIGYDTTFQPFGTQPFTGALIHYEEPPGYPGYAHLLGFNVGFPGNFSNPAMTPGSTWKDPYSELSLTVNSATPAGLSITVSYGGSSAPPQADSIISPASGTALSDPPATFCWANNGNYTHWLDVGTAPGLGDLYGWAQPAGSTCKTITDPGSMLGNGRTVYVTIRSLINGAWQTIPASSATYTAPLHSFWPVDGTVFTSSSVTFSWAPVAGATQYWLDVGPAQGNGSIFGGYITGTSQTVPNIVPSGIPIWVRLWAYYGGALHLQADHTYTACDRCVATITSPTVTAGLIPGSMVGTLPGPSATFCWNAAVGADAYFLDVGTMAGQGNLYGVNQGLGLCQMVTNIPTTGIVYVQLTTHTNGDWKRPAMQYRYLGADSTAKVSSPAPGTMLPSSTVTFSWNAALGAQHYWLDVGTVQGQGNIYAGDQGTATSRTVSGIPTGTIWVRLWTYYGGLMVPIDFQYTR